MQFLSMKLASVNPIFFDFAMDLDTLLVRPDHQVRKYNSVINFHVLEFILADSNKFINDEMKLCH